MNVLVLAGVAAFLYLYNQPVDVDGSGATYEPTDPKQPDNSRPGPLPDDKQPDGPLRLPLPKPKSAGAVYGLLT